MRVRQTLTSIAALLSLAVSGLVATSCNDTINEDSNDGDTGLLVRLDVVVTNSKHVCKRSTDKVPNCLVPH